jgi:indolepyruvate ferredoxin oxidoreductase alpha subunit
LSDRLLSAGAGDQLCILGNEAIARGAIEAGVRFVSGYPGTPASEIGDTLGRLHREAGFHFEWSVNEKVALEAAFGAAMTGARSLCHMKHLGLAYAGDPLGTIPYIGVRGGMVIVSAGDPGLLVSPNEQDQRHLARMCMLPVLEPSTPDEACAMTRFAFDLSEATRLPVIIRTTPAVAHTQGVVTAGSITVGVAEPRFDRDPARLTPIPVNARRMRIELDERLAQAEQMLADSPFFGRHGSGRLGVLAAGAPAALVLDQVEELGLEEHFTLLCAGATHPLSQTVLTELLDRVDQVLVVEELTPFVEDQVRALVHDLSPKVEIIGKRTGHLPGRFGYSTDMIADCLAAYAGVPRNRPQVTPAPELPPRPPTLCPGCPHRGSFLAARTVFGDDTVYFNDIGCYTLGYGPPLKTVDTLVAMGSSIAMAAAASQTLKRKTVAFVGDSTFFHSGMPPLLNAAETGADTVVVVLDNRVTAMTGHQPSPMTTEGRQDGPSPEAVARGLGIGQVTVVDPHDLKATVQAFQDAGREPGVSLIVTRRECAIVYLRQEPTRRRFAVNGERCRHCGHDTAGLHCGQLPQVEHERAMVRRRIIGQETGAPPVPAAVGPEPPCSLACPAGICVQGYVSRTAAGRFAEALSTIRRHNPLAAVSARVCHRPCEQVCIRRDCDGAVAINDLKRFLTDWEQMHTDQPPMLPLTGPSGRRVAVVGAGPSGLACALELRLRGHEVVTLDEHDSPGGLLTQAIPAHRLPRPVLDQETDWIIAHGIALRSGVRVGRDTTISQLFDDGFAAVYIGVGAMTGLPLGLPGDQLPGVVQALDLLRRYHRGELLEAAGKRYLIVGGGDAAVDAARVLIRLDAASVQIVYRRSRDEMPAHAEEVTAAVEEGVELLTQVTPLEVLGEERVDGLTVIRTEPGAPDESGRCQPLQIPGSETDLEADIVVAAIGQAPELGFLDLDLRLTPDQHIEIDPETGATSAPGIFAGGDVTQGPRTVIHAVADGRRAAYGIDLHLAAPGTTVRTVDLPADDRPLFPVPDSLQPEPGHRTTLRPPAERRQDHYDTVIPLSEQQARQEAARCLICGTCSACSACTDLFGCPAFVEVDGRMTIDQALCAGCGVCVAFCPNGAIHEVAEP